MTYLVLEDFVSLFKATGESYFLNGEKQIGSPMTNEYSRHLMGTSELFVSSEYTRFALCEIHSAIPDDTPLVVFEKGNTKFVALFLKELRADAFEQLKRIADYYNLEIEKPNYYRLPFFMASLDFSPVDEFGNKFKFIEEALDYCKKKVMSVKQIDYWIKDLPYKDAPFCVQSYFLHHKGLPSFATPYLDAKRLPMPNDKEKEWWSKNTAPYKCPNVYCNHEMCLGREYGCDSKKVSELEFGELTQYAEEPVSYEWVINGSVLRFYNEVDVINQDKFLRLCMRNLGLLPRKLNGTTWMRIINKALANMRVIGKDETARLTIDRLCEIITKDLKDRILVSTYFEYERLMQGYIYLDPATSNFVIHPVSFCSYITGRFKDLRIESKTEFYSVLRHLGFKGKTYTIETKSLNLSSARSRFLFKTENDWKQFLLGVSKGTVWEENFRAYLLDDNDTEQEELDSVVEEEIKNDALNYIVLNTQGV